MRDRAQYRIDRHIVARVSEQGRRVRISVARHEPHVHQADVPIVAGTDSPNPTTAHGVALHGELRILVQPASPRSRPSMRQRRCRLRSFTLDAGGRIAPGYG